MNCRRVQELILTGYSDDEISPELVRQVNDHLRICIKCRQFKESVYKTAVNPIKNAERVAPPRALWEKVKGAVAYEQSRKPNSIFFWLHGLLHTVFVIRKPVFAFAVLTIIVVVTALFMKMRFNNEGIAGYLETQVDFIAYLSTDVPSDNADYMNLDVKIEDILSRRNFYEYPFV